jgi:peptide chain release factor 3
MTQYLNEIQKRRTMAIISHPDAGKTTLTEKFLLYGGAVQEAGAVKARKQQRATASDWMELERKRGISVSSTLMQFEYDGYRVNLLDTPGHRDFSEDTYRVLTAVDSVIMVIDAAKGIESQTRKLFEVCRERDIPIFTFMNKMDRPSREPLELLDEIEDLLQMHVYAMNWPLGSGDRFRGVFDRRNRQVHLFERISGGGAFKPPVHVSDFADPSVREVIEPDLYKTVAEELDMLDIAGSEFNLADIRGGVLTPIFFGSALNNFGVQLMLNNFLAMAAIPAPRHVGGQVIETTDPRFSGFIFKILANMDPNHRDRIAFIRVCSGRFEKDLNVTHHPSGQKIRLSNARRMFGQERHTVEEAYAGDIIGLVGHSSFGIGDTLTADPDLVYHEIPKFTPECFIYLSNPNPSNFKKFRKGMDQLLQEGVVQELFTEHGRQNTRLLAAVGPLQFDVVKYRLESEYGAESRVETTPWSVMRWLDPASCPEGLSMAQIPGQCLQVQDSDGHYALLFPNEWTMNYFLERNPDINLLKRSPQPCVAE